MSLYVVFYNDTATTGIYTLSLHDALPIFDTQEIKTQVKVNNGETIVLGGIFQQTNDNLKRNVPSASELPIIGNLFKYKGKKQQKKELVIFITLQLVE